MSSNPKEHEVLPLQKSSWKKWALWLSIMFLIATFFMVTAFVPPVALFMTTLGAMLLATPLGIFLPIILGIVVALLLGWAVFLSRQEKQDKIQPSSSTPVKKEEREKEEVKVGMKEIKKEPLKEKKPETKEETFDSVFKRIYSSIESKKSPDPQDLAKLKKLEKNENLLALVSLGNPPVERSYLAHALGSKNYEFAETILGIFTSYWLPTITTTYLLHHSSPRTLTAGKTEIEIKIGIIEEISASIHSLIKRYTPEEQENLKKIFVPYQFQLLLNQLLLKLDLDESAKPVGDSLISLLDLNSNYLNIVHLHPHKQTINFLQFLLTEEFLRKSNESENFAIQAIRHLLTTRKDDGSALYALEDLEKAQKIISAVDTGTMWVGSSFGIRIQELTTKLNSLIEQETQYANFKKEFEALLPASSESKAEEVKEAKNKFETLKNLGKNVNLLRKIKRTVKGEDKEISFLEAALTSGNYELALATIEILMKNWKLYEENTDFLLGICTVIDGSLKKLQTLKYSVEERTKLKNLFEKIKFKAMFCIACLPDGEYSDLNQFLKAQTSRTLFVTDSCDETKEGKTYLELALENYNRNPNLTLSIVKDLLATEGYNRNLKYVYDVKRLTEAYTNIHDFLERIDTTTEEYDKIYKEYHKITLLLFKKYLDFFHPDASKIKTLLEDKRANISVVQNLDSVLKKYDCDLTKIILNDLFRTNEDGALYKEETLKDALQIMQSHVSATWHKTQNEEHFKLVSENSAQLEVFLKKYYPSKHSTTRMLETLESKSILTEAVVIGLGDHASILDESRPKLGETKAVGETVKKPVPSITLSEKAQIDDSESTLNLEGSRLDQTTAASENNAANTVRFPP